jgi:hypothetical protein
VEVRRRASRNQLPVTPDAVSHPASKAVAWRAPVREHGPSRKTKVTGTCCRDGGRDAANNHLAIGR